MKVTLRRRFDSTFGLLCSVGAVVATTCALLACGVSELRTQALSCGDRVLSS